MKNKKIVFAIALIVSLCFVLTGCFGVVRNIINGIDAVLQFVQAFGDEVLPDNVVYGSANELAVGFGNGRLIAFWDTASGYDYAVSVTDKNNITTVYNREDADHAEYADYYGDGCFYLYKTGLNYSDSFEVSLKSTARNGTSSRCYTTYKGISQKDYNAYTANVSGGFTTIDYYIATRYELFELFAYLIIFRPDAKSVSDGSKTYEKVEKHFYLGYDFCSLYGASVDTDAAFKSEILSCVASFEDSAAYNYGYELNGNVGRLTFNFYYDKNPYLISSSKDMYENAEIRLDPDKRAHYSIAATARERTFPIDSRAQSVTVSSSDQLYFAVKKGYKPNPVKGSNAEYVYAELRRILSLINADEYSAYEKIHNIYDYMVNTVIYDYDFVDNILKRKVEDESVFFSYNCLYIEGALGFRNGRFVAKERVAICDGLSKTFLCFTQIEGLESLKISGNVEGGAHAWNKINLNGYWYMVDTTWGNTLEKNKEFLTHDYLLVADDLAHEEDRWYYYPKANHGKYNALFG